MRVFLLSMKTKLLLNQHKFKEISSYLHCIWPPLRSCNNNRLPLDRQVSLLNRPTSQCLKQITLQQFLHRLHHPLQLQLPNHRSQAAKLLTCILLFLNSPNIHSHLNINSLLHQQQLNSSRMVIMLRQQWHQEFIRLMGR